MINLSAHFVLGPPDVSGLKNGSQVVRSELTDIKKINVPCGDGFNPTMVDGHSGDALLLGVPHR